ncbi:MAG: hypothetical protein U0412_11745 [Nitrospira sp.]
MTPKDAATALFKTLPKPISVAQIQEYGIEATEQQARQVAREILSLNLYWILAAVDAHILQKYRALIGSVLYEFVTSKWTPATFGLESWDAYRPELEERREYYTKMMDDRLSPMALSAEAATLLEDQQAVSPDDRQKLLVLLIDYAPVDEYARLLDDVR